MQLLVIGGTSFLGRAVVEEALARGADVTTFNRGVSADDVPGVTALRGDRADDAALDQLAEGGYDGVVDTCGFVPEVVGRAAARLAGNAAHYVFVSSLSAVPSWPEHRSLDGEEGRPCPADAGADHAGGDYGVLKAGCERAVTEVFGDRSTAVRAGLILGPHENVGRLPWWLRRIAEGGEVLAPGDPAVPMQLIDARDLATFMVDLVERPVSGTLTVTGPAGNTTMGAWLGECVAATGSGADLTWVDDRFLLERGVEPWTELPLWMPSGQNADHAWDAQTDAAEAAGLRTRPVAETVHDTWAWLAAGGRLAPRRSGLPAVGLDRSRERDLLRDWHTGR